MRSMQRLSHKSEDAAQRALPESVRGGGEVGYRELGGRIEVGVGYPETLYISLCASASLCSLAARIAVELAKWC